MSNQLSLARSLLISAELAPTSQARWRDCLAAVGQAAAALLAARRGGRSWRFEIDQPWASLAVEVPALAEWASYFALLAGQTRPSERQADDLLRDARAFCELVETRLNRRTPQADHG